MDVNWDGGIEGLLAPLPKAPPRAPTAAATAAASGATGTSTTSATSTVGPVGGSAVCAPTGPSQQDAGGPPQPPEQGPELPATPIAPALVVPADGIQQIFDVLRAHEERLRVTEIASNWCKATLEQQQTRQALKSFKLVLDKRSTQEQAVAFAGRFFKAHGINIASIDTLQSPNNTQLLLTAASFTERIAATKCVAQVEPKFFGSAARTMRATPGHVLDSDRPIKCATRAIEALLQETAENESTQLTPLQVGWREQVVACSQAENSQIMAKSTWLDVGTVLIEVVPPIDITKLQAAFYVEWHKRGSPNGGGTEENTQDMQDSTPGEAKKSYEKGAKKHKAMLDLREHITIRFGPLHPDTRNDLQLGVDTGDITLTPSPGAPKHQASSSSAATPSQPVAATAKAKGPPPTAPPPAAYVGPHALSGGGDPDIGPAVGTNDWEYYEVYNGEEVYAEEYTGTDNDTEGWTVKQKKKDKGKGKSKGKGGKDKGKGNAKGGTYKGKDKGNSDWYVDDYGDKGKQKNKGKGKGKGGGKDRWGSAIGQLLELLAAGKGTSPW